MSQWTHITGSISADVVSGIPIFGDDPGKTPKQILEELTGSWKNGWHRKESEYWPEALENRYDYGSGVPLPEGSEGPMKYAAFNMGSRSSMNNGVVTFWGNLRDYGPGEVKSQMIPYFEDLIRRYEENGVYIRNMAIQIDTEGDKNFLLTAVSIPKPGGGEFDSMTVLRVIEVVE